MAKRIEPTDIEVLDEIGDGSYAVVHKGIFQDKFVAVKKFDGSCPSSCKKQLENEIQILGNLNHQNIVKLFGFCDQRNNNFLVLEYMAGGSLFDLLSSDEKNIKSCNLVQDICNGMEYLHSNSVLHLDLKSSNVILNKEKDHAKITDFGISKISTLTTMNSSNIRTNVAKGTFRWMAPEISNGFSGSRSSDVWSFGCILIEIMTRKLPFSSLSDQQLFAVLQNKKSDLTINIENFSKIMAGITYECLKREANKRPTFNQLKASLSKCTQIDFDLKNTNYETNSIRTLNDLNNFMDKLKNSEQEDKKDKQIQELNQKLSEKDKDLGLISNNVAQLTKQVDELKISNQNPHQNYQSKPINWHSVFLTPPDTPNNYILQNREHSSYGTSSYPSNITSNYSQKNTPVHCSTPINKTQSHSGRDTGCTYVSNGSANGRTIYESPRGYLYYLRPSGSKGYVDKKNIN